MKIKYVGMSVLFVCAFAFSVYGYRQSHLRDADQFVFPLCGGSYVTEDNLIQEHQGGACRAGAPYMLTNLDDSGVGHGGLPIVLCRVPAWVYVSRFGACIGCFPVCSGGHRLRRRRGGFLPGLLG